MGHFLALKIFVSWQIIEVLNILLILILSLSTQGSIYNTVDSLSHAIVQDGIPVQLNLIPCIAELQRTMAESFATRLPASGIISHDQAKPLIQQLASHTE